VSELELPRVEKRLPKATLSPAEAELILSLPNIHTAEGLRDRAILEVLYSTGIRRMEVVNLTLRGDGESEVSISGGLGAGGNVSGNLPHPPDGNSGRIDGVRQHGLVVMVTGSNFGQDIAQIVVGFQVVGFC
jgi:hypothetical protein